MLKKVKGIKWPIAVGLVCALMVVFALGLGACTSEQPSGDAADTTPASGDTATPTSAPTATEGAISVVAREDGSGTRSAFVELFKVEEEVNGEKVDATTPNAVITNSTAVMLTTISGDERAIGYISLGSLDTSVKALDIDGVAATTENVKNSSYAIQRPFNLVDKGGLSAVAQDFMDFILSSEGQAVVEANHYVAVVDGAKAYTAAPTNSGKVVVAGSSSVTPVMEKLKEAYEGLNPDVTIEIQQSDSSTGIQAAIDGICDIGMASRELKDTEVAEGLTATIIARDGIAVIVNTKSSLSSMTSEQVKDIYTGAIGRWEEVAK
ncbi:MAG: substrate-binding domain-containing protein [Coriobacteriales bacterium]|jgi:phosphate transport system substrate-binding protein|nr:substrate-binding domain-containing protein [Coriobacteriales bacterium]